jgi:uncharacterized protein (DUF58 family)
VITRTGWAALGAAAALVVCGRVFGIFELYVIGAGIAALVVIALIAVRATRLRLEVAREVIPAKVHAGSDARVEVRSTNLARWRSPLLRLRDPVSGTRGALLHLAPLAPGGRARAAYRLPTGKRGVIAIGPLTVQITDPFGLTTVTTAAAAATDLTVYPKLDTIRPLHQTHGRDPHAGAEHPNSIGQLGEDFYALRPYVVGDDLRRVHWASTARHDDLMVRQDELPWQGRASVLLDVRRAAHTPESLELAVSAAASIVTACWRRRDLARLLVTDGTDSGFAAGHAHVEAIMEYLATVELSGTASMRAVIEALARSASGGALVVVVAAVPSAEMDALLRLRRRFSSVTVVAFGERPKTEPRYTSRDGSTNVIVVGKDQSFADEWDAAMRPRVRSTLGRTLVTGGPRP